MENKLWDESGFEKALEDSFGVKFMKPTIRFIEKKRIERSWGTENILTDSHHYLGKINIYKAGKAGGLQKHQNKDETFHIVAGEGYLDYDNGDGKLTSVKIGPGDTIHIPPFAVHRIRVTTQIFGVEFSNNVIEDRHRCETEYGEPEDKDGLSSTW